MIPNRIENLFKFIDFLYEKKEILIKDYLPLCEELKSLDEQRNELSPLNNYKDKQQYEEIQKEITDKFAPITNNIYNSITDKLLELKIWSGDKEYSSILNNNINEVSTFKENFSEDDLPKIFEYKNKYIEFRTETNSNFLCLGLLLQNLDELFKSLFDFFKDTTDNEFKNFESKIVKVNSIEDLTKIISKNRNENIKYELPISNLITKNSPSTPSTTQIIKNEYIMGDKIEAKNIDNSGQLNIGKDNSINNKNNDDTLSIKSFNWQKWGIIIASILAIIGIMATIYFN